MGIRSLLRNAFGRSKATREETGAAPSGADKPESATIPEAREESAPGAATPEAEVPAARTAPTETPDTDPAPAPKTPTLPAQGGRADRGEQVAQAEKTSAARDDAEAEAPEAAAPAASDLVSQAFDNPTQTPAADVEPAAAPAGTAAEAAEPQAEPEPVAEAKTAADAEPVAEAKTAADAEPVAEAKAAAEPASEAEAKTEAETEAKAADQPAPTPEPEPAPEAEPKPEAAAPAPEAEPKADVEAKPEPEPEPKADATPEAAPSAAPATAEAEPRPETPGSPGSLPAVAPALVSLYKSAGATLDKHGLATQRAAVYLVLDRSGSMRNYYKDGTVQNLAEQALGLAAHFDDDATVPVVFFSTDIDGTADIDLANYEGRIAELHAGLGHMGRTNYHWAVDAVVDHYKKSGSTAPAFVIFQTDGAPTSKPAAEKAICEAAGLPIFWQFIGFGDPDAKGFDFLRKLDDLTVPEKRAVDNAGFFHAGRDPRGLSHDELYQQLMVEFPEWLAEARAAGIVKDN
ncbi:VWA domain-containing protein [Streptomyces angustmyceticus]|uniref:vWA domain-containing protein n=1 Tax=Streptomyces angustmyceticus TaxID=285578 RepID=UPI003D8EF583